MTTSAHHTRIQVGGVTVDPTNVRLDLDENRVPFALSTIEAAYDPDLVDQLDPRNRVPVHVSMRQSFGTSRTLADVSADYAGMVLDDMGALSDTLNDNPSMEDGTTGWAGLNGTTAVQTSDQARTGTYSLEVIPPPPTPPVNLLTSTQARCSSTDGWGAIEGCTRSVTSAQAAEGSTSIAVTSGGARIGANTSPLKTQVAEGTQYTAVAEVRAATSGRTVRPYIVWQTSSGVTITSVLGSVAGDGTSSWTPVSVTGTAPAGAALAYLEITFGDAVTPAGEVHYIDKAGFFEGTNTAWVAPPPTLRFVDLVSDPFAVSQGSLFFCRAWARLSGATNTRAVSLDVEYLDEADNIMDSDSFGATLLDSTDGWVPLVGTALVSDNPDVVAARIVLSASIDPSNQRLFFDDVIMRYARSTLASFTAEYGEPYNSGGWRPSTKVRAALWLRNRTVDHEAGTVTIEAASADAALTDYSLTSRTVLTPSGSTVRDCVNLVLGHTLNAALPAGDTGSQTVEADALPWEPGETGWQYLSSIIGTFGLRLWCDEVGLWHLEDPETIVPPRQWNASVDNASQFADTISRDQGDWADSAVVTYEWDDSNGVAQTRYDAAGVSGGRTITRTVERPYPGSGLARGMLRKAQALGRVVDLGAPSDYSLRPYDAAQVTIPDAGLTRGVISGVTWSQPDDSMTVRTRGLLGITERSWLYTPPGVGWEDVPDGTSWSEYQWGDG